MGTYCTIPPPCDTLLTVFTCGAFTTVTFATDPTRSAAACEIGVALREGAIAVDAGVGNLDGISVATDPFDCDIEPRTCFS